MRIAAAAIESYEATTLTVDGGERLACLYVVVDSRSDRGVADFLAGSHPGCGESRLDWQAVRRPRSALVGIDLLHACGQAGVGEQALRLVFDVERDAGALAQLAATETLVLGSRPYGSFANVVAAYGIDGEAVRQATAAATRGLHERASLAG
jgi:hypothetical protein